MSRPVRLSPADADAGCFRWRGAHRDLLKLGLITKDAELAPDFLERANAAVSRALHKDIADEPLSRIYKAQKELSDFLLFRKLFSWNQRLHYSLNTWLGVIGSSHTFLRMLRPKPEFRLASDVIEAKRLERWDGWQGVNAMFSYVETKVETDFHG